MILSLRYNLWKRIISTVLNSFLSIFFVITITFFLFEAIPGDLYDLDYIKNENVITNIRNRHHLDDPFFKKYLRTVKSFLIFDLGCSTINDGRSVKDIIRAKMPVSAVVGFYSIFLSFFMGIILGLIKSNLTLKKRWLILLLEILAISVPVFVLSILFQYFFSVKVSLFPVYWNNSAWSFILPILALSIYPIIFIERVLENNIRKIKKSDYIAASIARGG